MDGLAKASILDINGVAVPAAVAPPLDTYSGAEAAYSVRLLRTLYTGPALRIRRSGDDIEADVEFDSNNEISLTSPISNASSGTYTDLADFVDHSTTPRDAFCVEWKDQSGNGNDATQPTAGGSGLQPKLYDATTGLIITNGKPGLEFDNTNDYLRTAAFSSLVSQPTTWSIVCNLTVTVAGNVVAGGITATNRQIPFAPVLNLGVLEDYIFGGANLWGNATTTGQKLLFTLFDGNSSTLHNNSTLSASGNAGSNSVAGITIGGRYLNDEIWDGTIQEIIFFGVSQSSNRTGIQDNVNGFFSVYP